MRSKLVLLILIEETTMILSLVRQLRRTGESGGHFYLTQYGEKYQQGQGWFGEGMRVVVSSAS